MSATIPGSAGGGGGGWALGCECGYVAGGDDEDGLVADARRHARAAHRLELSREQILRSARAPLPRPAASERAEERGGR